MSKCNHHLYGCNCRKYGFFNFLLDFFLVCITGGLWLIWVIIREIRRG